MTDRWSVKKNRAAATRRFGGLKRVGSIRVSPGDKREPLLRLLQDGNNPSSGLVEVAYDQQWRTLFRAQRLGLVDDRQRLTDAGRKWLAEHAND